MEPEYLALRSIALVTAMLGIVTSEATKNDPHLAVFDLRPFWLPLLQAKV